MNINPDTSPQEQAVKYRMAYKGVFCTQLTFDLILRPRGISRLGIYPYRFYFTYRNIISMDASFYPILPSDFFSCNGLPTSYVAGLSMSEVSAFIYYIRQKETRTS